MDTPCYEIINIEFEDDQESSSDEDSDRHEAPKQFVNLFSGAGPGGSGAQFVDTELPVNVADIGKNIVVELDDDDDDDEEEQDDVTRATRDLGKDHPESATVAHSDLFVTWTCPWCKPHAIFKNSAEYKEHIKATHSDRSINETLRASKKPGTIHCQFCNMSYRQIDQFNIHMRDHRDNSVVVNSFAATKCGVCQQWLCNQAVLDAHKRMHAAEKARGVVREFVCDICGFALSRSDALAAHRRRHFDEERKYPCTECGERFFTTHKRNEHENRHKSTKTCKDCGKTFRNITMLEYHQKEVHAAKRKRIKCDVCSLDFCSNYNLKRHLKSVHRR